MQGSAKIWQVRHGKLCKIVILFRDIFIDDTITVKRVAFLDIIDIELK